ncbi:recombinase family protein (plasmid) [Paracoccus liaowanqingii]|uniref:Recombinase family protein n=1 Tax=Paracoccus liaowanqingii TaxID=2560053 RepID=A0A4Y5SW60_9RHOB|nr:recombinase family protein [Paracoccus liaowanqingii]
MGKHVMAIGGYPMASTSGQEHRLQHDALNAAGCDYVVSEAESGADENARPRLRRLLSNLSGDDTLVVWRLDRLAQSVKELITVANRLSELKVCLRSLNEQIDTTTPQGRMMFHVFALIAQCERDLIAERTRAGLEAARASGRIIGRRRLSAPAQITQAQAWLTSTQMTQAQAAKALGVSRATLIRALSPAMEHTE